MTSRGMIDTDQPIKTKGGSSSLVRTTKMPDCGGMNLRGRPRVTLVACYLLYVPYLALLVSTSPRSEKTLHWRIKQRNRTTQIGFSFHFLSLSLLSLFATKLSLSHSHTENTDTDRDQVT
jgi:hypothetical protein